MPGNLEADAYSTRTSVRFQGGNPYCARVLVAITRGLGPSAKLLSGLTPSNRVCRTPDSRAVRWTNETVIDRA